MTIGATTTTDRPAYIPTARRHATLDTYDAPIVDYEESVRTIATIRTA